MTYRQYTEFAVESASEASLPGHETLRLRFFLARRADDVSPGAYVWFERAHG